MACNTHKSNTQQKIYNRYREFGQEWNTVHAGHAEVNAIRLISHLNINWKDAVVYTYRVMGDGGMGIARPCASCIQFIKDVGIETIMYSTPNGYACERLLY